MNILNIEKLLENKHAIDVLFIPIGFLYVEFREKVNSVLGIYCRQNTLISFPSLPPKFTVGYNGYGIISIHEKDFNQTLNTIFFNQVTWKKKDTYTVIAAILDVIYTFLQTNNINPILLMSKSYKGVI